jgi:hypothetical protein
MGNLASLYVTLGLTATAFHEGLITAAAEAEEKSRSITNSLASIGKGVVIGVGALVAGGVALIGSQVAEGIKGAEELQNIQAQLNAVLANTGSVSGVTAGQVQGLAEQYSGLTKFSYATIMSADTVLARFNNISKDTFPAANMAAMNLATTMKTDLPSAAQLLGKILEQPGTAMMRLRAAGVTVTPALDTMLKKMQATGDTAGAQKVILDALSKSIGGAAEAAGATAAGGWAEIENKFESIKEKVGAALLPTIQDLEKKGLALLNSPEVQTAITNLTNGIANFAKQVMDNIPNVITWFKNMVGFLQGHQGIIVAILAVIGVAVAAFGVTAVISIGSVVIAALPIIAVIALIAAAAYLLYTAWKTDWGGIQEKVAAVWAWLQPVLQTLWDWLQTNIPKAIQTLKDFWENTLLPAIKKVWAWVQDQVFPIIIKLIDWLKTHIPEAIQTLQKWWNDLKDTVQKIWDGIQSTIKTVSDAVQKIIQLATDAMSGNWYKFGEDLRKDWDAAWAAIKLAVSTAWTDIKKIVGQLVQDVIDFFQKVDWAKVGHDIIQGIVNGIGGAAHLIVKAAEGISEAAVKAIRGFFGMHSPSTLMIGIGENLMVSWAQGMNANAHLPAMAAVTASSAISNSSNSSVNIYPQPTTYRQSELSMSEELDLYKWRYRF